jgi:hypothetical protein
MNTNKDNNRHIEVTLTGQDTIEICQVCAVTKPRTGRLGNLNQGILLKNIDNGIQGWVNFHRIDAVAYGDFVKVVNGNIVCKLSRKAK